MGRSFLLIVALSAFAGCGRIGFDLFADETDAGIDTGVDTTPDFGMDADVDMDIDMGSEPMTYGIRVTAAPSLMTTEVGGTATFTVALIGEPTSDVTIALSSTDTTEGTVSPETLTFTSENASSPQTVTVTGVDDFEPDGPIAYSITLGAAASSDLNYSGTVGDAVMVTNVDNETAGITVTPTAGLVTSESGASATFSVVLNAEPANAVTISLASSDTSEGVVDPAELTFTAMNWDAPQVVTVTGVNDDEADGSIAYQIITGDTTSSDSRYEGLIVDDVSVSNTDNDTAGVTVTPTSGLSTSEGGATATFTVVLNTAPSSDVTIDVASTDSTEGTADPASLTFTSDNWSSPQTVTVTGVNDAAADGNQMYTIALAAIAVGDSAYLGVDPDDVSLTNIDDDTPGVTVLPTSGLVTSEIGDTATFSIVLNTQPASSVVIALSSDDLTEGTVAPSSVTFTAANWDAPQIVTVTGVDDFSADGDQAYGIATDMDSGSSAEYAGLPVDDVSVVNNDNDSPGITVAPTSGLTTSEMGAFATFTLVLDTMPSATVTIALSVDDASEGHVTPSAITFTRLNWAAPQTVTVTGNDDALADGNQLFHVVTATAFSADSQYSGINPSDVSVTNVDNDSAGVTITPTSGLSTSESGTSTSFTVQLNAQPAGNVTIGFATDDASEGYAAPASLTFSTFNWASPQTIVVFGQDDLISDGNQIFHIVSAAAVSTDGAYSGLNPSDVTVTNLDDDIAAIVVTPTSGLVTNEGGASTTFSVVLQTMPTANVTIALSSDNVAEGTVSPATLTFTPANYSSPHIATVTGVNDFVPDGDLIYHIVTAAAVSMDTAYSGLDASNVTVTNVDNDSPSIVVSPTTGLATAEMGTSTTFTIVLTTMPSANVSIALSSDDLTEGTVLPASVTFTSGNWNVPQTVTVTGVDDALADGPQTYHIVTATAVSTDSNYSGRDSTNPTVVNYDNDGALFTIVPRSGLSGWEGYNPATFTVRLASPPVANVNLTWHTSDATEGDSFFHAMTFTTGNWNSPQSVPVYATRDEIDDGDMPYQIVFDPATSADPNFNGADPGVVSLTSVDMDAGKAVMWREQGLLATTEGGGTAQIRVWLRSAPSASVTMNVTSTNTLEGTVSPSSLTFTTGNWATPQIVTVTGVSDALADGNVNYDVVLSAIASADVEYNGMSSITIPMVNCNGVTPAFQSCLGQTSYPATSTDDFVTMPDSASVQLGTGNFTISAWGRIDPLQPNRFPTIVSKRPNSSTGFSLLYCMWNCGSVMLVQLQGINYNAVSHPLNDGVWRYYTLVRTGTRVDVYINATLEQTFTGAGDISGTGVPIYAGNDYTNPGQSPLNGGVHGVRIWNTALTVPEIRTAMWNSSPLTGVAYWPMNDGAGQTISAAVGAMSGFLGSTSGVDSADPTWTPTP